MTTTTITWPPNYTVRKHRRARHVKLRTSSQGLEITVPYRFSLKHLPSILEENKYWIIKKLAQLPLITTAELPESIHLQALQQTWQVRYRSLNTQTISLKKSTAQQVLILEGNIADKELCKKKLRAWLKLQAKKYLSAQLHYLSIKSRLTFSKISIRNQRTLWGSCTINAAISLNYKLILLPERLVNHILLHELCHTQFLNHSQAFWGLLASFDPGWRQHKKEIKHADGYIPGWV